MLQILKGKNTCNALRESRDTTKAFSGSFRLVLVYSGTILVHFVSFRCYSTSFRHIPVYSVRFLCLVTPVFLVYSALFCCHSALFPYIPVPFLFIPSHSGVIRFYSRVILPCSGIFWYILLYLCVIPPHSGVILARASMFRYHSCSFRCHSASFWYIPVYSGIFRSIPFLCLVTPLNEKVKDNYSRVPSVTKSKSDLLPFLDAV